MFRGKNYKESAKLIDKQAQYEPQEAFELITKTAKAKFDETVELHVKLGVDSRHADQQVRGAIVLPHGTGKVNRVLVFCKEEQVQEALDAGADYAGGQDLVAKIQGENWFEFDTVIASPNMMGVVGRLGKVLGPKGLMPSPKAGTVSTRPTSSTARSARSALALRSSPRTTTRSSARSSRPSRPPRRASTSSPASRRPPWAPASRSLRRSDRLTAKHPAFGGVFLRPAAECGNMEQKRRR